MPLAFHPQSAFQNNCVNVRVVEALGHDASNEPEAGGKLTNTLLVFVRDIAGITLLKSKHNGQICARQLDDF